jgi:hypothetical protein
MRRLLIALSLSTAIAAPLAAIPSTATAGFSYSGCTYYYPTACFMAGPQPVYDAYALDRNRACGIFGPGPLSNGFADPCPGGPLKIVCVTVEPAFNVPGTGWSCGEGLAYQEPGGYYGYTVIASYLPYEGSWLYDVTNWFPYSPQEFW